MSFNATSPTVPSAPPPHTEFMIGWICVLQVEYRAAVCILDERYEGSLIRAQGDRNHYVLGRVGAHNIAINLPAAAMYGQTHAYKIASDMKSTFPQLRCVLLVGIGGGVPCPKRDIRLGDVVLGTRAVPYASGKETDHGFERTGEVRALCMELRQAIALFEARLWSENLSLWECVERMRTGLARDRTEFHRPTRDRLYKAEFLHKESDCECTHIEPLARGNLCARREREGDLVRLFQGGIGSENQVMKNARVRDQIATREQIVCYEMEAAAVMDVAPCLSIRGISDYADGHKNDDWQPYAALSAAVCARELLLSVLPQTVAQYPLTLVGDHLERYVTGAVSNPNAFSGSEIEKLRQNRDSLMERHNLLEQLMRWELRKLKDSSRNDLEQVREEVQRLKNLQRPLEIQLEDLDRLIERRSGFISNQDPVQRDTEAVRDLSIVAQSSLQSTGQLLGEWGSRYENRDLSIAGDVLGHLGELCGHAVTLWKSTSIGPWSLRQLQALYRKTTRVFQACGRPPHPRNATELEDLLV
ncbi:nucleoside phosphorylase domain-containing protein [Aspergillus floccosus]